MKYIFQQGGEVPQESTDFFNQYVDQLQQQRQQQLQAQQVTEQQDQQPADQESDYIKNLRSYDEEQSSNTNTDLLQQLSTRLQTLEKELNYHQQSLEEQQNNIDWFASDDGQEYTRGKYDTQTSTSPVFAVPSIPSSVIQQRQLQAESGGYDNAISPKGARGAYQFMPATWDQYKPYPSAQPTDRRASEIAYTNYMQDLTKQFNGDQRKAVAAYNYGPGNVNKLINTYGDNWEDHLPAETSNYLNKVFGIRTKNNSVDIFDVNKNLLNVVSNVSSRFPGLVVTSGTDGKHTTNSAHYDGAAVDIGANSSSPQAYYAFKLYLPELQQKYGVRYLDEGDHIHLSLSNKGKL